MGIVNASGFSETLRSLAHTAKLKSHNIDEAFLAHADPRAVTGGAIDEEAESWRELARLIQAAARKAKAIESEFGVGA